MNVPSNTAQNHTKIFFAMGTAVSLTIYTDAPDEQILDESENIVKHLESLFSTMRQDSDISRINIAAGLWCTVHTDTDEILQKAIYFAQKTDGAYEPAIFSLVRLWDIKSKIGKKETLTIPNEKSIREVLCKCDWHNIETDGNKRYRMLNGAEIDLGAAAKGFTSEKICKFFSLKNINSAMVSLGNSSIAFMGTKPDGSLWKAGLKVPGALGNEYFAVVSLKDKFLSVSGGYERYFVKDGKRYHHIFDKKTGYPTESGLESVTVISDDAALSEAYSTALFVMGPETALDFYKQNDGFEAVFVTSSKHVYCTDGLKSNFEFCGKPYGYLYRG
ncbi:MAG: FAD:protein FMN transferase [Endomicrobium sp.]|jgi:thiamine biosynthesis lipoprotein|nr:FAD:protein FMN transferase [Endomicrobium sp.]